MDSVHPAEATKTAFELVLLGPPTLRDGHGQIPVGLGSGKPLALLCFLTVRGEVRREEALALLWGDVDEDRARNAFRQALHRLRLALGEDLVVGDRQNLKIVAGDRFRADVLEFEKAGDESRLEEALALYRGDFLAGFDVGSAAYDEWMERERRRLRSRCQSLAERALQRALVEGRLDDAEASIRRLLTVAPLDARVIEVAAASLVSIGKRVEAAEVIEQFSRASSDELGAPLPRALQVLLDRLAPESSRRPEHEPAHEPGLVGRSSEVARLLAIWNTLADDAGATVVVEGFAGIGKSRLVREFAEGLRALGAVHVLHGIESPRGFTVPYAAVASALRPLVRAPGVAGASPHLLAEAARILPELRDAYPLPPVASSEEDTARLRVCEGIAALLESSAFERPICLILEDVHRATSPSLDLIGYLATRLRRAPVLLLLTFTTDGASPEILSRLRALAGGASRNGGPSSDDAYHLVLGPLAAAETHALVTQVLGSRSSAALADRIAERAGGIPLRAVELARLALDGTEPTMLPARMGDIARDRIQACSANERRLFLVAALLSRPATLRVLAEASHVPARAAGDAAHALIRRGLLVEEGIGYRPSSEAAADASLDLAGEATIAFVAGWAADVLAREPDASPAELVRIFAQAGRISETHKYARDAGERAIARGAIDETLHFLTIARAFARTKDEHAAVESLLSAHGAGRPRLAAAESFSREGQGDSRFAVLFARHFPNWRYLAAAAAATCVIAIALTAWGSASGVGAFATTDTLLVAKDREARSGLVHLVTSDAGRALRVSDAARRDASTPAWVDSVALPWVNARPSPAGRYVSVERITPGGSNVYLISADRRDTIPLATGAVEAFGMGWSPDGASFLVTRRIDNGSGEYQVGLYAFSSSRGRTAIAIDTTAVHAVTEAAWSPDGSRIAWVARVAGRQEEVFVSWADGSHRRNLSAHPARDDHIAWSADGSLLAFTSRRDGNAELYAFDLLNDRLWRLTQHEGQDDRAAFSGDGRFVAFESTRNGAADVYVMPSLGGAERRIGDSTSRYEIVAWRRSRSRYIDRLELDVPESTRRQDTVVVRVRPFDQFGAPMIPSHARWGALDAQLLSALPAQTDAPLEQRYVALRDGLARVEVSIGAWRTDTAYVRIGDGSISLIRENFRGPSLSSSWRALGRPLPTLGVFNGEAALLINSDRQWDSGVLSSTPVPVQRGLAVHATLHAPFDVQAAATSASLALVAPDPADAIDAEAPSFLRLISITWNAESRRFTYAAEREVFVEPIPEVPEGRRAGSRILGILVNPDGTVSFQVDGLRRWRSTVRVVRANRALRAQIWVGGQNTGARVAFANVTALLDSLTR